MSLNRTLVIVPEPSGPLKFSNSVDVFEIRIEKLDLWITRCKVVAPIDLGAGFIGPGVVSERLRNSARGIKDLGLGRSISEIEVRAGQCSRPICSGVIVCLLRDSCRGSNETICDPPAVKSVP